jgi:hypothetical protein
MLTKGADSTGTMELVGGIINKPLFAEAPIPILEIHATSMLIAIGESASALIHHCNI